MRKKLTLEHCVSDAELAYIDLSDAFEHLNAAAPSPVDVRRWFGNFVNLTQRLRAMVKRDFSARTNSSWDETSFTGWNPATTVLESLRDIHEHAANLLINVHERHTVQPFAQSSALVSLEGTWQLHDQTIDAPPDALAAYRADPVTGEITDELIPTYSRERTFLLHPRDDEMRRLLSAAGTSDVHKLAAQCFETLTLYMDFYRGRLALALQSSA